VQPACSLWTAGLAWAVGAVVDLVDGCCGFGSSVAQETLGWAGRACEGERPIWLICTTLSAAVLDGHPIVGFLIKMSVCNHSLSLSLLHSPSPTRSLTLTHCHSPIHLLTLSHTHPFTHPLARSHLHSRLHSSARRVPAGAVCRHPTRAPPGCRPLKLGVTAHPSHPGPQQCRCSCSLATADSLADPPVFPRR
jgi:hypothetical protein